MKIRVLTDNTAGSGFLAEHGLSFLIEADGKSILFDTGHTDVFLRNALRMGVNIQNTLETVVLSHGHWDHGDGLQHLYGKTLITHPSAFMKRYRKSDRSYIGLALRMREMEQKYKIIATRQPIKISEGIWFLGEIPRLNSFEATTTSFVDESGQPDFVPDDSALAVVQDNKLYVITGCSHSGICNIVEHAKKVSAIDQVHAVIGGFHLKHQNEQTKKTIEYFRTQKIPHLLPSHCTELPALAAFYETFKISQLKTGTILEF